MAGQEHGRRGSFPLPALFRAKSKRPEEVEEPNYATLGTYGQTGESLNERLTLLRYRFSDLEALRQDFEAVSKPVADFLEQYASSQARLAETEAVVSHMRSENRALNDDFAKLRRQSEEMKLDHAQILEETRSKDQVIGKLEEQLKKRQAAVDEARITVEWQTSKILAEEQKVLGNAAYGTTLVKVRGSYDDVNRLCTELSGERDAWAFVNVNLRPYYAEGSKTLAYEIAEQLGWRLPEQIVIPVASGSQLTKIDKGFKELIALGLVEDRPYRIFGTQATGCSPVSAAFKAGHDVVRPVKPATIAKSLAIGNPVSSVLRPVIRSASVRPARLVVETPSPT